MTTMTEENKEWERNYWHKRLLAVKDKDSAWQKLYTQYLDTGIWKEIRRNAIVRAGYRCERCSALYVGDVKLQVHHKTYDRVGGFEKDSDLQVVCAGECHRKADIKREQIVERKRVNAWYQSRFNAWGEARYKNDWDRKRYDDELEAEEEFHKFVYKKWCEDNEVSYNSSLEVPELFVDLLKENREKEYEEYYGN